MIDWLILLSVCTGRYLLTMLLMIGPSSTVCLDSPSGGTSPTVTRYSGCDETEKWTGTWWPNSGAGLWIRILQIRILKSDPTCTKLE